MKKPYVFIAEDNPSDIFFIKRVFDKEIIDYDVIVMDNVNDSLLFFQDLLEKKQLPNLVLLDIRLNDGSGFEILEYIKNENQLKNLPVLIMSSSDRKEDVNHALEFGANSYLEKIRSYKKLKEQLPLIVKSWAIH